MRITAEQQRAESINVAHSRFLAESPTKASWKGSANDDVANGEANDVDSLTPGKGKLSPTSSHLFKLILPLDLVHLKKSESRSEGEEHSPPTIFLLHPSQPLSHISRLIISALMPTILSTATRQPSIGVSFQSTTPIGNRYQWSDSTDLGDFIRDAAKAAEFDIRVRIWQHTSDPDDDSTSTRKGEDIDLPIEVPTFKSRTRFLRLRLNVIERQLKGMEDLKAQCDHEAHRGARRMAVGGFGMLVVYWGAVARLTFWDYGWDVMEPITYLSGLSTVILGYLWFLYQGRELSYTSILNRSISSRRQALYSSKGLDIDRWMELINERKLLRIEIEKIRGEYEGRHGKEDQREFGGGSGG